MVCDLTQKFFLNQLLTAKFNDLTSAWFDGHAFCR